MNDQPRAYTKEEMREKLLNHVRTMINKWEKESRAPTSKEKLEGFAFSILTALDGSSGGLPPFTLTPDPHPDDEVYLRGEGKNWWTAIPINDDVMLHEVWNQE